MTTKALHKGLSGVSETVLYLDFSGGYTNLYSKNCTPPQNPSILQYVNFNMK